jgi:hypothetical protein
MTFEGLQDTAALAIAERTVCRFDDSITVIIINVRTTDGQQHQATGSHGQAQPATQTRLADKFRDCCYHAARPMPSEVVEEIIGMVDKLSELDDVGRLVALVAR